MDKMRAALEMAKDILEAYEIRAPKVVGAIEEALTQPESEPVGEVVHCYDHKGRDSIAFEVLDYGPNPGDKLYTSAQSAAQLPLNFDNVLDSILSLIDPNTSRDDELLIRRAWDKARIAMLASGSPVATAQVPGWVKDFICKVERLANQMESATKEAPQLLSLCLSAQHHLAAPSIAQVPEGWHDTIATAIQRARVFDDGSDGADAESAQSVVALLTGLLTATPSMAEKREWIRCVDRLPTAEDADSDDAVWWACFYPEDKDPWLLARKPWTTPGDAAYWMPTGLQRPEPPGPKP